MGLTRETVERAIATYIEAWETQDPELILEVFTETAVYHERVLEEPTIRGHAGIRQYWTDKVVNAQANITCKLLNLYLDGATAVAEWEAHFDDLAQDTRKRMREVAILEFDEERIAHLREYWASDGTSLHRDLDFVD